MIGVLVVVAHVLGLVSSVHAIMTTRTAQGAIAWAVSLNTFPYVAVPTYWVFGRRKFAGYVEAFQDRGKEVSSFLQELRHRLQPHEIVAEERIPNYQALKALARAPLVGGNDVDLLIDGEATFDSIIEGIGRAREFVLTANFDNRSFRLNFEVTALVVDGSFALEMERMLQADLDRSVPFDAATLETMPFHRKLAVRAARLLSPIL